jgi:hypothetical protein
MDGKRRTIMTHKFFAAGHALIIGVGADLPNTMDDAKGLADILKDPGRCAYPTEQVLLLTSQAANRKGLLGAMDKLAQTSDKNSTVIIYFSGHGYRATSSIGEAYFLIPYGCDPNQLSKTAINGSEFAAKLRALKAKKLLLLLDCCHAGGVGEAKGVELAKAPIPPETLDVLSEGRGRVIIASSQADELSYAGKPYSAFTLALIESLCGVGVAKKDGFVRVADLAMHAREVVPGRTGNMQHPILNFEQADNFVIAYYAGGESSPKALPFPETPEIEPEPGVWRGAFNQQVQIVHGPQTNIAGDVNAPVLSGVFSGQVFSGAQDIRVKHLQKEMDDLIALLHSKLGNQLYFNCNPVVLGGDYPDNSFPEINFEIYKFWSDVKKNLYLTPETGRVRESLNWHPECH